MDETPNSLEIQVYDALIDRQLYAASIIASNLNEIDDESTVLTAEDVLNALDTAQMLLTAARELDNVAFAAQIKYLEMQREFNRGKHKFNEWAGVHSFDDTLAVVAEEELEKVNYWGKNEF
jgi:hypothetical protein